MDRYPLGFACRARLWGRLGGVLFVGAMWACGGDDSGTTTDDVAADPVSEADATLDVPVEPDVTPDVTPDAPPADVPEEEDQAPPVERRSGAGLSLTGAAGARSSDNYLLRVAVGPPMPIGQRESQSYILILGPQALHP